MQKVINFRIPDYMNKKIEQIAKEKEISKSDLVRSFIVQGIQKYERKEN